ncbi:MAG: 5'-nucleotidase, lipoprotein e(P4) family [Acidobacteriota bacterium]
MLLLLTLAGGCSSHRTTHEGLNGTLWVQTSGEYEAITTQTFDIASTRLEEALADSSWTADLEQASGDYSKLPPAIIADVDETILDNSPFQARLAIDEAEFSEDAWKQWVHKRSARALPGAKKFLDFADSKGVTIFYVTNRDADLEESTRVNLTQQDLPVDDSRDTLFMRGEKEGWGSDKASRREVVAKEFRILLLLGDDLNDFFSGARTKEPGPRRELVEKHSEQWGRKWIVFPNPLYGSWEASLFGRAYSLPDEEKLRLKYGHLAPFEP